MAYFSNQKVSYSKSPDVFYSSLCEERGLKQWANPSCFHLAVTTESSLPQIQVKASVASCTCYASNSAFVLFIPGPGFTVSS